MADGALLLIFIYLQKYFWGLSQNLEFGKVTFKLNIIHQLRSTESILFKDFKIRENYWTN